MILIFNYNVFYGPVYHDVATSSYHASLHKLDKSSKHPEFNDKSGASRK